MTNITDPYGAYQYGALYEKALQGFGDNDVDGIVAKRT